VISQELAPMHFHRRRRDHWMRLLLMQGQKLLPGLKRNARPAGGKSREIAHLHEEAIMHAREVLRPRDLEWPGSILHPSDQEILEFLEEMETWLTLVERLGSDKSGMLGRVAELLETRIQTKLHLTHRMPMRPAMY